MAKDAEKSYIDIVSDILSSLSDNDLFLEFKKFYDSGENKLTLHHKYTSKKIDVDWVNFIEDCIISFDNVIRVPKKFIAQEEEVISTSLARSITTDSIKHLAQHTNLVNIIDGEIKPEKILNIRKEESYQVYENRFAWTLLQRLSRFIDKRFEALNKTIENAEEISLENEAYMQQKGKNFKYELKMNHVADLTPNDIDNLDRIEKIKNVISGFYASTFAKHMKNSEPVRPPIVRTNSILKNPDYQKLLQLWQFVESYDKEGYTEESNDEVLQESPGLGENLTNTMFLNYLLIKSLIKNEKKKDLTEEEQTQEQEEKVRIIERIIERNKQESGLRDPDSAFNRAAREKNETNKPSEVDEENKVPVEDEEGEERPIPYTYKVKSTPTGEPIKVEEDEEADQVKNQKIEVIGRYGDKVAPKQKLTKSRILRDFIERAIVNGEFDDADIMSINRRLIYKRESLSREKIKQINLAIDRVLIDFNQEELEREIARKERLNRKREEERRHLQRLYEIIQENEKKSIQEAKSEKKIIEKAIKREQEITKKIDEMNKQKEKLQEQIELIKEEMEKEKEAIDELKK